jgi:hypothetical protein
MISYRVRQRLGNNDYRALLTSLDVVLVMAGAPLAIMIPLGLLTLRSHFPRARRYRPDQE